MRKSPVRHNRKAHNRRSGVFVNSCNVGSGAPSSKVKCAMPPRRIVFMEMDEAKENKDFVKKKQFLRKPKKIFLLQGRTISKKGFNKQPQDKRKLFLQKGDFFSEKKGLTELGRGMRVVSINKKGNFIMAQVTRGDGTFGRPEKISSSNIGHIGDR